MTPIVPIALLSVGLAAATFAAAPRAGAQAPPGPLPPKPGAPIQSTPGPPAPNSKGPTIRVQVELVTAPVAVRDETGQPLLTLTKKNFHVFDNGAEQTIQHFDLGGDPLSIAIVMETSSRIEPMLPALRKTGIIFTQAVLGKTGEGAVVGFDDEIATLLPFTTNEDAIEGAVTHLREGTSGARLYDAMSRAISLLAARPANRRRVLIAVTEAVDTGSETTMGEVLRTAQLANVTIYCVGLSSAMALLRSQPKQTGLPVGPPGTYPVPLPPSTAPTPDAEARAQGVGYPDLLAAVVFLVTTLRNGVEKDSLDVAAVATGGAHLSTVRDRSIEKAIDEIGREIHTDYILGYHPPGDQPSGYHEIKVTVDRPGAKVRTRPGYYLPPPPAAY